MHQNYLKTSKNINLKQRKNKIKKYFFKNIFEIQKQIGLGVLRGIHLLI